MKHTYKDKDWFKGRSGFLTLSFFQQLALKQWLYLLFKIKKFLSKNVKNHTEVKPGAHKAHWASRDSGKVRQYPHFVRLFHTSTPLRSVELSKEWQGIHDWWKLRQYPYFVRLFHTSTSLRSVELSKEWQGVHDWGKLRQYPRFVRLFHTSTPLKSVELSKKWRISWPVLDMASAKHSH